MTRPDAPGETVPAEATARPLAARTLVAVAVGGALGTAARIGFGDLAALGDPAAAWYGDNPVDDLGAFGDAALLATLAVNLLGSLLLGVIAGAAWPARLDWLRAGCGAGFCGAFTTFSFVALVFAVLGYSSGLAWGLLISGVLGGLLFVAIGAIIGRAISPGAIRPGTAHPDTAEHPGSSA
ncbi:fluoride efflux transporter FluC [Pseudoclavibacter endophyticus]|uniref:fluoride efflux transporter FluC n=1 Tax=Pseudoclavibacter endophyticus TaxID=1778590 RepID=UPI00166D7F30|nr:CrcB family protein [Pseudoclavibacter endophyticus]